MLSWKLWSRRAIAVIIFVIVFAVALCAVGLLRYFLAAWSTTTLLLASCAVFAFFLVAWGGGWLGATVWRAHKCRRFTAVFSGVLTAAFVIALYLAVLRPSLSLRLADAVPAGSYGILATCNQLANRLQGVCPALRRIRDCGIRHAIRIRLATRKLGVLTLLRKKNVNGKMHFDEGENIHGT